jgi:K+-transporting ATPase c subunit
MTTRRELRNSVEAWLRSLVYAVVAMLVAIVVLGVAFLLCLRVIGNVFHPQDSTGRLIGLAVSFAVGMVASSAAVDLLFRRRPTSRRGGLTRPTTP